MTTRIIQVSPRSKPPLFLPTYERIFRTIHGMLLHEQCDPALSCQFFGIIGTAILEKHHGLPAVPVVGAAGYNLGTRTSDVLVFAEPPPHNPSSTINGFHCWIEVNGWAIDFQAPLFGDRIPKVGVSMLVPRYMMQKSLQGTSASMSALTIPRAYWYERNPSLETQLLASFHDQPVYVDLVNICVDWYKPHPQKMIEFLQIGNNFGEAQLIQLSPIKLDGAW